MGRCAYSLFWLSFLFTWAGTTCLSVSAKVTPYLEQGFFFDYNIVGQPVPIPVTEQCATINLKWSRSAATGPNPVAPYYLQIYTSTFIVPFWIAAGSSLNFDWAVPFTPGTQYQICMFDSNGVTGGCQAVYTVTPSTTATTPSCQNVTFPAGAMDVEGIVWNGPLSEFGWVDQCTDIQLTPKNGTPPYIMTVAPALHPPYNITSKTNGAINWTVSLGWAAPFFISLIDSGGNSWAYGPLHSGSNGPTSCLDLSPNSGGKASPAVLAGAGVGGLVLGALIGVVAAYLISKRSRGRQDGLQEDYLLRKTSTLSNTPTDPYQSPEDPSRYRDVPTRSSLPGGGDRASAAGNVNMINRLGRGQYQIEPFVMPAPEDENAEATSPTIDQSTMGGRHRVAASETSGSGSGSGSGAGQITSPTGTAAPSHVYVVHHDGGRAPVTVYTPDGTEVVELPPRYREDSVEPRTSASPTQRVPPHQRPRQPGANPRKAASSAATGPRPPP